ncbi:putative inorganic phosphate cotransporter [Malaya genurostris]|uniref:putative inorganic phosphate cotransporter n=1 Tax=Malaya genurostris TaxID=325434 RepID=UPI0026F3DDD2|nr:putative inorganic phosphate cotransporter [Malaya genurostris]
MNPKLVACCQSAWCISMQHLTTLLAFFSIVNQYTMRICLSLAITEMVQPTNGSSTDESHVRCRNSIRSGTEHAQPRVIQGDAFEWDEYVQGIILSAFFWGYVLSHFGSAFIADRYPRLMLGLSVLITAVLTLLTPLAIDVGGAPLLIATRAIEGIGEGATFPVLSAIVAQWIPPHQRGTLGSFIFSGGQIGSLAGGIGTGFLLSELNSWRMVFYVWGTLAIVWYIFWVILGYESPESHPFIKETEKQKLIESFADAKKKPDVGPIPWRSIAKSVPFWGLVAGQIGHDWGFYLIATDLPKYMKSVLGFSVKHNGMISYFPFLCMWIFSVLGGWICDKQISKQCVSITAARKMWTTIGSLVPAISLLAASYAECNTVVVVVSFAICVTFMGGFYPGIKVNVNDLSPNYAGFLMAVVNGFGAITGILVPYTAGWMTPNQTIEEWRNVFWLAFWVLNVTNVIFIAFASGEIQPWNDPNSRTESN